MRARAEIETLQERREKAVEKFAVEAAKDCRFAAWFPQRRTTGTRSCRPYLEKISRTDRNKNSPVNYMIRKLNDLSEATK